MEVVRNATNLEGVPNGIRRPSPDAGEHSREVLVQFGLAVSEISELQRLGVVQGGSQTPPSDAGQAGE